MIGRTSGASRFNIYKFSEVLGLRSMEKVINKRDDFVVDALFYFEPVRRFEYSGDMFSFGVPVTGRAREFCKYWIQDISFVVNLGKVNSLYKKNRMYKSNSNS